MTPTRHVPFLAWTLAAVCASAADPPIDFSQDVAPILEKHCLHCHSDNISKGDVSLSTIKSLRKNEYVVSGDPESSHLVDLISGKDPEMPNEGEPLSAKEVAVIRSWITDGAAWPTDVVLHEKSKADGKWWSLHAQTINASRKNPNTAFLFLNMLKVGCFVSVGELCSLLN